MGSLAQADGRPDAGVLEPAHRVDPRSRGVDDDASAHGHDLAVDRDLGAGHPPVDQRQRDDLRAVEHRRAVTGGLDDVLQAKPRVVRPRVGVERARAKTVSTERGDELPRAIRLHEPVEP
jgi:hypothetical protein